ncbi:MAG: 4Fe-4S binding protein [Candidatus Sumerlaeota bacterium]|nr:4Fe-4S binding protein [Candidatus Sumerlaeota bacterium]
MNEPRGNRWSLNHFARANAPGAERKRRGAWGALRRFGVTWRAAPLRRLIQVLALAAFLLLFFHTAFVYGHVFSSDLISRREWLPVEFFLWLDPLAGLAAAVAARAWNIALWGTLAIFAASLFFPRGFCGYLCPLGTLIDGFDSLIGRCSLRYRFAARSPWRLLRYVILFAVLGGALGGAQVSGYVAAIPALTRGLMFSGGWLQLGLARGWQEVAPLDGAQYLSLALFALIFLLGFITPRFWCRHCCPTGAVMSLCATLRLTERKVMAACGGCGHCRENCPYDAVGDQFHARPLDCASCQTCGGVCPQGAVTFEPRWNSRQDIARDRAAAEMAPSERALSRRALLLVPAAGLTAAVVARAGLSACSPARRLLRPPGSLPEADFLKACVRCGECFKVCPGPVLYPAGFESGWDALWTPVPVFTRAGCHQDCNFCTHVCPTGAIRLLTLEQKRKARMGMAVIDRKICLPHCGESDCRLCFEECEAAGYHAIEMREIRLPLPVLPEGAHSDEEIEAMSRIQAPFVIPERCVGCGLCEYRCHTAYAKRRKILPRSAIAISV